jgi:excinuclease ABC subunit A
LFSYNSKHGWCPDCVGTGLKLTRDQRKALDDSVRDDEQRGREQSFAEPEVEDLTDTACPACEGSRLNATARAVRFQSQAITDIARLSVGRVRQWVAGLALSGRSADIARDLCPRLQGAWRFWKKWAWATSPWTGAHPP